MIATAHVLAVLVSMPPCWADRDVAAETKAAQLSTIADAVAQASLGRLDMAAYLITIGYHESKWCLAVHAGERRGGQGEGLWQLEGIHHGDGARSGLSPEDTVSAAFLATAQLKRSRQCGREPAAVLTASVGRPCSQAVTGWPTLASRVRGYWWAISALRRAGAT